MTTNRSAAVKLTITLEAFGTEHKEQILKTVKEAGFEPTLEDAEI